MVKLDEQRKAEDSIEEERQHAVWREQRRAQEQKQLRQASLRKKAQVISHEEGRREAARSAGIGVVAMTGEGGGRLADHADILLEVPSSVTMHIQESHIALGHVVTLAVERLLDL